MCKNSIRGRENWLSILNKRCDMLKKHVIFESDVEYLKKIFKRSTIEPIIVHNGRRPE